MSVHPSPKPTPKPYVAIELDRAQARFNQLIVIHWKITRRALGKLAPAGQSPMVHLEARLDAQSRVEWILIDPKTHSKCVIDSPQSKSDSIHITHSATEIVIESPTLCAHLQLSDQGSHELVYIRTNIFASLKIPGGRYEPIGCSVQRQ